METKIIKEPVYETKRIQTGEKEKTIYISNDGKEFSTEEYCKKYEKDLESLEFAKKHLKKFEIDDWDLMDSLMGVLFDSYDNSSIKIYRWSLKVDELDIIVDCLKTIGIKYVNKNDFRNLEEGDDILIFYWSKHEPGEHQEECIKVIKYKFAVNQIEEYINKLNNIFK